MEVAAGAAGAAGAAVAFPGVVVGSLARCSHAARVSPAAGMRYRLSGLGLRSSWHSQAFSPVLHARRNPQPRHSKLVFAASIEDTTSVNTKVDDAAKVDAAESSEASNDKAPKVEAAKAVDEQTEKSKVILDEVADNLKNVLKMQEGTKQVYAESAEKAIGVLKDTTDQLKEQADKARAMFLATAQETAEKGKENLSMIAENSPDPLIKDIAETALNAHFPDKTKQGARIHDFCLGIPYGAFLLVGGLIWFLISGSTAAIRFGVFLGGVLLSLSVTSLKVWKRGESSIPYINAQAAITSVLVIRELRRYAEVKAFFPHAVMALISVAMLGFYGYVFMSGGNPPKKSRAEPSAQAA